MQGLSDMKLEIKCDHRNLIILALLVATDWDKSMGGRALHKRGILEKKRFLVEFPCDGEQVWLVLNVIKFLISKQGEG